MIILPPITENIIKRPGNYEGHTVRSIPNPENEKFWKRFYSQMKKEKILVPPIRDFKRNKVNPLFGFFGFCFHPVKQESYFHTGLDISGTSRNAVHPVADATLEYSGFGAINGNYVLLKHENIKTEDGYTLYSMYAHLKKYKVGFNTRQKMLREISLHTYPKIEIKKKYSIGVVGDTGNLARGDWHVHVQLEFRRDGADPVAIDPLRAFGFAKKENKTADMKTKSDFEKIIDTDEATLKKYNLLNYWK